jgi:translocation and assembly module TamB
MLLAPLLPVDLDLAGAANANAEIIFESAQLKGAADIQILPGTVSYLLHDGEREQWPHHGGTANIFLNEHGINASSTLAMKNDDKLQIVLALPGAQLLTLDPEQQILIAEAKVSITDLGLIEALIPDIENLKGELAIELAASGAMSQPQINGRAHLLNGTLQIPRLGLSISQLAIKSQSDGLKDLQFKLDARSGTGTLAIEGNSQLDSTAGWPTTFSISGDQFEVAHIPEASVQVSPRLQVNIKNHTIDINGDIHIPYAKLQPRDTTTAVHVSDDAVIVGTEEVTKERWTIYNRTRLTLGERVHFYGFGFEGRLSGTLLLVDEPGQLTKSTGEINIAEGHYRAYGQRLSVEQGKLLYAGGPLMNPGLDLRAVRHVGNITSGLKVRGTLNQPQLELFSVPVMGQTNALAYLLLGRPIESASGEDGAMMAQAVLALGLSGGDRMARSLGERFGIDDMRVESSDSGDQASLVVGRYLSPKLYISYGVGLMDTLNTLAVRYQISDSWQLKGESGESQGADILYTIER